MSEVVQTGIFCPHCANRIELQIGLGEQRILTTISLQAEHFGTQITCSHCGVDFVYTRYRERSASHLGRPHFSMPPFTPSPVTTEAIETDFRRLASRRVPPSV